MTAALTRSNCEETFKFSAGQRTVRVSVTDGGRMFHADGPATENLHGPKPAVLVRSLYNDGHKP